MPERIYRDPVHNIIRVDTGTPVGRLAASLIDTREFQRLRRIRQLGIAHFAYQGAEHSRFTHSLGTFHLATRVLDRLEHKHDLDADDIAAVRIAALLHDVGHGPFSHVVESILGFHHEDFTIAAVTSDDTEISELLDAFSPDLAGRVASIINGTFRPAALAAIVSSQLDVDRMDYLLRDSLMTGVKYGVFDLEWVLKSIEIDEEGDRLYISAPGVYAVEDYLQARYYMYRQVYFHRTLRAAEAVLRSLLRRAIEIFTNGGDAWCADGSAFRKILESKPLGIAEHLSLDDSDIVFHIKKWTLSGDPMLADLARRFIDRKLFKAFDLDMPAEVRSRFVDQVRMLTAGRDLDPDYYVVEDDAGDVPYYFYKPDTVKPGNMIFVEDGFSHPTIREISEVSSAVRGLQKGYRIHRLCFPSEITDEVAKIYHR